MDSSVEGLATRAQILRYRTLTQILHLLEQLLVDEDAGVGNRVYDEPARRNKTPYQIQRALDQFATLVVKQHEIAALMPTRKTPLKSLPASDFVLAVDEPVCRGGADTTGHVESPAQSETPTPGGVDIHRPQPPPRVTVDVQEVSKITHMPRDPDEFVSFLISLAKPKRRADAIEVPLTDHVGILRYFLTGFASFEARESDEFWGHWIHYVVFASLGKIRSRVQRPKYEEESDSLRRNIWEHLTMDHKTLESKIQSFAGNVKGFPETSLDVLTAEQKSFLEAHQKENGDCERLLVKGPFYSVSSMTQFHAVLSAILVKCDDDLDALDKEKRVVCKYQATTTPAAVKRLLEALAKATAAYNTLYQFSKLFQNCLKMHFRNLEQAFGLKHKTHERKQKYLAASTGNILSASQRGASIIGQAKRMSPVFEDRPIDSFERMTLEDAVDDNIEIEEAWESRNWSSAAMKYLELGTQHFRAAFSLARKMKKKEFAALVTQAPIHLLSVNQAHEDHQLEGILEVANDARGVRIVRAALIDWLAANFPDQIRKLGDVRQPQFNGTLHAEAILLSIIFFKDHMTEQGVDLSSGFNFELPKPGKIHDNMTEPQREQLDKATETYKQHMSFSISAAAIELCDKLASILGVSKACCPSCTNIVDRFEASSRAEKGPAFIKPASHKSWTATTLPPWMPAETAEDLICMAELEIYWRIHKVLERRNRRVGSSGQTSSSDDAVAQSGSDDDDSDGPEPEWV